ncbi:MAG TPA: HAMP domain-containing sensor histidine kinase, partial [Gaiellales bacterium]
MTLRGRLLAAFAYLLLLTVIALAVPLAVNVDRRAKDSFYSAVDSQTQVIAASLGGSPQPGKTIAGVRQAVATYGRETDARVIVTDGQGRLLADSERPHPAAVEFDTPGRPEIGSALAGRSVRLIRHSADLGGDLLVVAYPVLDRGRVVGAVRVSQPVAAVDARVHRSWLAIGAVAAAVALVGMIVAWLLASSLARPIHALGGTAARLGRGDLDARAPEAGPRDVADVARAMNRMAAELESLIESQREFVGNASHQLRTPLTGLRLRLEALSTGPTASDDARAALVEVDRLAALVSDLLVLARAGVPPHVHAACDLRQEARAAADRWRPVAAEHGRSLALDEPGEPVAVAAESG